LRLIDLMLYITLIGIGFALHVFSTSHQEHTIALKQSNVSRTSIVFPKSFKRVSTQQITCYILPT
jgi:hypothetical protein